MGRTGYRDTVVYLGTRTSDLQLMLTPLSRLEKGGAALRVRKRCGVEGFGRGKLLVPSSSFEQAATWNWARRSRSSSACGPA